MASNPVVPDLKSLRPRTFANARSVLADAGFDLVETRDVGFVEFREPLAGDDKLIVFDQYPAPGTEHPVSEPVQCTLRDPLCELPSFVLRGQTRADVAAWITANDIPPDLVDVSALASAIDPVAAQKPHGGVVDLSANEPMEFLPGCFIVPNFANEKMYSVVMWAISRGIGVWIYPTPSSTVGRPLAHTDLGRDVHQNHYTTPPGSVVCPGDHINVVPDRIVPYRTVPY